MDVQEIARGLWHWTAPHPDWKPEDRGEDGQGWDEIVSSYALVGDHGVVLIDPQLPPEGDERERFWAALDRDVEAHGPPIVVLTVYWHARSAGEIADRYEGAAIWAPNEAAEKVAERVRYTDTYGAGDELPGGIRVYDIPRVGETVLYVPSHKAVAFGDAVLDGVRICPQGWLRKGVSRGDVADDLRPLLDEEIELILLTHGGPVGDGAREKLERALEV